MTALFNDCKCGIPGCGHQVILQVVRWTEIHIRNVGCLLGGGRDLEGSAQDLKILSDEIQAGFSVPEQRDTCGQPVPFC